MRTGNQISPENEEVIKEYYYRLEFTRGWSAKRFFYNISTYTCPNKILKIS